MPDLTGCVVIGADTHSGRQWFVIDVDGKFFTFQLVPKMINGQVNGQQLPTEGAVFPLG